jgi:ribosomal protein S18 acetylase RimI-like enzyme
VPRLVRFAPGRAGRLPLSRGEQPFLHAWKANTAAIALYESLGFRIRAEVNVAVLEKPAG